MSLPVTHIDLVSTGCREHTATAFLVKNRVSGACMENFTAAWKEVWRKEGKGGRGCLNDLEMDI